MIIEYDTENETLYLRLKDGKIVKTKEFRREVFLDFDKNEDLLGIELLNLEDSKYLVDIAKEYSKGQLNRLHPGYLKRVMV